MDKIEVVDSKVVYRAPYFSVRRDNIVDLVGNEIEYFYQECKKGVVVVPVKIDHENNKVSYVMVKQYRHPTGEFQLEFPRGGVEDNENYEQAAIRELKEETGYVPTWTKFLYKFYTNTSSSNNLLYLYMAIVSGEASTEFAEDYEKASGLEVVEITSDELLEKIKSNEITDGQTLSALTAVLLQTEDAKKYIIDSIK